MNIRNRNELIQELIRIYETDEVRNTRLFALALAYIIGELCPPDRSTKRVMNRAYSKDD